MKVNGKYLVIISLILFFIGFIGGMVILGISIMGDFEALMFKPAIDGKTLLTTLKCPVIMTSSEKGTISITLSNPTDGRISPSVWTHISAGYVTLVREERENLFLEPGESQQVQWDISKDNAAFGKRWVLVKLKVYSQFPLPSSYGACGIFVADILDFTGTQIHISSITVSMLLMGLGIGLYIRAIRLLKGSGARNFTRPLFIFGSLVFLGLISTLIGSYLLLLSAVCFFLSLLAVISFVLFQEN